MNNKEASEALGGIVAIIAAFALIFFMPVIGVLLGAFSGWAVGVFFTETIMTTLSGFGFSASVSMWQLGATLGFIGGFFRISRRDVKVVGAK